MAVQFLVIEHLTPLNIRLACRESDLLQAEACAGRLSVDTGHVVVVVKKGGGVITWFPRKPR